MTHNADGGSQGGARVRKILAPPIWFAAAILVGALLPGLRYHAGAAGAVVGMAVIAGGLAVGFAGFRWFRKTGQDAKPWTPSPELIVQGSYRYTRNPMYVGMTLAVLGIGILAGRGWMAVLAFCALLAVHYAAVLPEERYLAEKFGAAYDQYRSRVRRSL